MSRKRAGEHSRSDFSLASNSREHALRMNEEFRRAGIAAEYEIKADGERAALIFRDRNGRKRAHEHLGVFDRDAGYGDQAPQNL